MQYGFFGGKCFPSGSSQAPEEHRHEGLSPRVDKSIRRSASASSSKRSASTAAPLPLVAEQFASKFKRSGPICRTARARDADAELPKAKQQFVAELLRNGSVGLGIAVCDLKQQRTRRPAHRPYALRSCATVCTCAPGGAAWPTKQALTHRPATHVPFGQAPSQHLARQSESTPLVRSSLGLPSLARATPQQGSLGRQGHRQCCTRRHRSFRRPSRLHRQPWQLVHPDT